jgi:hypothetical protein
MTTITPDMIQAFKEAYGYSLPWTNDNIRAGLAAAFAAAPEANPLARRVEALESQMRDLHKIARKEMDKLMATNYVISTPPAPDAEKQKRAGKFHYDDYDEVKQEYVIPAPDAEGAAEVKPKLVVTDELVRQCAEVYIQVLTGLDPSVHEIRHTEEAMREVLKIAAAVWGGEESHA